MTEADKELRISLAKILLEFSKEIRRDYEKWRDSGGGAENEALMEGFKTIMVRVEEVVDLFEKEQKAFGGCQNCYGKGYSTTRYGLTGSADFVGDKTYHEPVRTHMAFCACDRGQQLQELFKEATKGRE